jgi:hypothetical protein
MGYGKLIFLVQPDLMGFYRSLPAVVVELDLSGTPDLSVLGDGLLNLSGTPDECAHIVAFFE